ncbi:UbiD-like decarboxylase [Metarhizium anisopliae]|nr:UbiD-like decarboxylase [Metarhizium anisopliae]
MVPVTAWAVRQGAEVLSLCQAAALPIRMAWNLFRSHDLWFILRVDEPKLHALNTDMRTFSNKVVHTVFTSELGFCIPPAYLAGQDVDPRSIRDIVFGRCHAQ